MAPSRKPPDEADEGSDVREARAPHIIGLSWAMRLLLNAGFGDPLGLDVLRDIHGQGFAGIRQEMKRAETVRPLCEEIAEAGMQAILLVRGGQMGPEGSGRAMPPAEIAALAREVATVGVELDLFNGRYPCAIEVGNEPDNAYEYESRPELFAEAVRLSREAIRDLHPLRDDHHGGGHEHEFRCSRVPGPSLGRRTSRRLRDWVSHLPDDV